MTDKHLYGVGFYQKDSRSARYGKIPLLLFSFSLFSLWSYFSNRGYNQQGSIEFSSYDKTKINPELYVGSYSTNGDRNDVSILSFEDPKTCPKDRLYLEPDIENIGEIFRNPRSTSPEAKIPVDCILYSMRSFMYSPNEGLVVYSYCDSDKGTPVRGKKTACLTPNYVYPIYNAYVDVMDCLAIPQTDLIPKLLNESGFHTNALGFGMDAGVGQLTGDAIRSVLQKGDLGDEHKPYLDYHLEQMRLSSKESCKRVLSDDNLISAVSPKQDQRCNMIAIPGNPLRNLLYTGIFYRYVLFNQAKILYSKGENYIQKGKEWVPWDENSKEELGGYIKTFDIYQRFVKAGIKEPNMNAVKQMMITLGYNAGMRAAVIMLGNYLKARIKAKLPLKESDFDFVKEDLRIFNTLKSPKAEGERQKKLAKIKAEPFRANFPIYLKIVQKTGTRGYLSNVASKYKQLNSALGENRCTSPNFLQF